MKLKNKLIKEFALNENLKTKNNLYASYQEHDPNRKMYVLVDSNDIIICNQVDVEKYLGAGFEIFGAGDNQQQIDEIVKVAEVS